jgi:hypothetical protein
MKSVGIVRKMDQVGRIVLPISLRHTLNIDKNADWRYLSMGRISFYGNISRHVYFAITLRCVCIWVRVCAKTVWSRWGQEAAEACELRESLLGNHCVGLSGTVFVISYA